MLLKTIQNALTRQLYEGVSGTVIPRGLAYPLDPFLFGTVRFGKKAGFEYSLLVPDNRYALTEDAIYLTDRLILDRSPAWISSGDFVSVGLRELHRVEDVSKNVVILATPLLADYSANTFVYHHSAAIIVEGSYAIDQTTINIDTPSTWVVVPGDVICISFDTDVDVLAFNEYTVETVVKIGTTSAVTQWMITLDRGVHRGLTDGETIQLRAYPAYTSRPLKIPQSGEAIVGVVGPYLLDWTSMPFVDKLDVVEYQTLQYLDNTLVPTGTPIAATKNLYILDVPIRADQFFFWDKVAGDLNYDNTLKRVIGQYDSGVDSETEGWWWIKHTAVPTITVPTIPARGYLVTPAKALLVNNDSFIVGDDVDQIKFEYKLDGAYVPTSEAAAVGAITVAAFPGGHPVDNDTLVLDNGFGTTVTFEFKRTLGFISTNAANRIIDVIASALPTDIAVAVEAAVNSVQAVLGISAVNAGPAVTFTNSEISTLGNTNITGVNLGVWAAGAPVVHFTGGTDKVETIDISSVAITSGIHVANLTAAAINRSGVHVRADYTSLAPSVALTSTVPGPLGNVAIVESVITPGFIAYGMSGGFGGKTWGCRVKSTVAATLRIRLYPNAWQDTVLVANTDTAVAITFGATDLPIERIDILAVSTTPVPVGAEIQMSDWTPNRSRVKAIQHSYVARVHGERNFACTGVWAKQVFRSFDDLRLPFDNNGNYDAGFVML